jgi:hypothetical protein
LKDYTQEKKDFNTFFVSLCVFKKNKRMKKINFLIIPLLTVLLIAGCKNYEPKVYGPVEFEIDLEGPFFKDGVTDGMTIIPFKPEDFGITRDEIFSMKVNEIALTTEAEGGFGMFENLVFSVMTDDTETKEVASTKVKSNSKELKIKGLQEAEIEGFKGIKEFYLEITGITKEESFDDLKLKGTLKMDIMIPENK